MRTVTITYGVLLIALGVGAWLGFGRSSMTALIPAFFGLPITILGVLAARENLRKHVMHAAAAIATLGFLGSVPGLVKIIQSLGGAELARPGATAVQAVMAVLSLVFVILCVRSFIAARRAAT